LLSILDDIGTEDYSDDEVANSNDESLFSSPAIEEDSPVNEVGLHVDGGADHVSVQTFLDQARARLLWSDTTALRESARTLSEEPPAHRRRILPATFAEQEFQLFVRPFQGDTIMLRVTPTETISAVKYAFIHALGYITLTPRDLRLIHRGMQLEDHRTLSHYNIRQGDTVHSLFRVRGGMKRPLMECSDDDFFPCVGEDSLGLEEELRAIFGGTSSSSGAAPAAPVAPTAFAPAAVVQVVTDSLPFPFIINTILI